MFCFVFITWFIKFITQFLFLFLVWFPPSSSSFLSHFCFLLFCFTFRFAVILFLFYFFLNALTLFDFSTIPTLHQDHPHPHILKFYVLYAKEYVFTCWHTWLQWYHLHFLLQSANDWLTDWLTDWPASLLRLLGHGCGFRCGIRTRIGMPGVQGLAALCSQLHALTAEMRFELSLIYVRFKL